MCVMMVDAVIFVIVALVLFKAGVFLVAEAIFVSRVLFSGVVS